MSACSLPAIVIGLAGVVLLSDPPGCGPAATRFFNRAAGMGLVAGALFGVSAIGYRGASLALGDDSFLLRATTTLVCVTVFQSMWRGCGCAGVSRGRSVVSCPTGG